jgi:hypothetical protein
MLSWKPEMSSPERAPSLVALAAAHKALASAALQVRGVREWMQRYDGQVRRLGDEEAVRLWVFIELTREAVERVRADSDELAQILVTLFLNHDGRWPLTDEQEREFHEVLAALAAREAQISRNVIADDGSGAEPSEEPV